MGSSENKRFGVAVSAHCWFSLKQRSKFVLFLINIKKGKGEFCVLFGCLAFPEHQEHHSAHYDNQDDRHDRHRQEV
jgi:hypothetical protein